MYYYDLPQIDVHQLANLMAESIAELQLIDVREPSEAAIAQIPGFALYPLSEFELWSENILSQLEPAAQTIVICHHGIRSAQLCQWLAMRGFREVFNVSGGIDAYARFVDSKMRRY